MSWLPSATMLGDLSIDEVFVDYDGPRVFSCRSSTGQIYVAGWAEESSNEDLWLYVPVSEPRLAVVRSGGIPLAQAFTRPEGFVYLAKIGRRDDEADEVDRLTPADLEETWLPAPTFRLRLPTQTTTAALEADAWRQLATSERRARMRLMMKWTSQPRTEAPTRRLGEVLVATQSVIDNIGLALLRTDPPQAGRIPHDVAQQTATSVVGLSAASFVVDIASESFDDLFDGSTFADVAKQLLSLLDTIDRAELVEQLSRLRTRGAKSFRNFVGVLANAGFDITIAGAGATLPYTAHSLSAERLHDLYDLLESIVPDAAYEIRGRMRLYRADTDRKLFGVVEPTSEQRFEGQTSQRALSQLNHASLDDLYEVVISEFNTFNEVVGERKPTFVLEQLVAADNDEPAAPMTRVAVAADELRNPENSGEQ